VWLEIVARVLDLKKKVSKKRRKTSTRTMFDRIFAQINDTKSAKFPKGKSVEDVTDWNETIYNKKIKDIIDT
jgi:hypothetical protein